MMCGMCSVMVHLFYHYKAYRPAPPIFLSSPSRNMVSIVRVSVGSVEGGKKGGYDTPFGFRLKAVCWGRSQWEGKKKNNTKRK